MGKEDSDNYLALTGPLPDLDAWSAALPSPLNCNVKQWRPCELASWFFRSPWFSGLHFISILPLLLLFFFCAHDVENSLSSEVLGTMVIWRWYLMREQGSCPGRGTMIMGETSPVVSFEKICAVCGGKWQIAFLPILWGKFLLCSTPHILNLQLSALQNFPLWPTKFPWLNSTRLFSSRTFDLS